MSFELELSAEPLEDVGLDALIEQYGPLLDEPDLELTDFIQPQPQQQRKKKRNREVITLDDDDQDHNHNRHIPRNPENPPQRKRQRTNPVQSTSPQLPQRRVSSFMSLANPVIPAPHTIDRNENILIPESPSISPNPLILPTVRARANGVNEEKLSAEIDEIKKDIAEIKEQIVKKKKVKKVTRSEFDAMTFIQQQSYYENMNKRSTLRYLIWSHQRNHGVIPNEIIFTHSIKANLSLFINTYLSEMDIWTEFKIEKRRKVLSVNKEIIDHIGAKWVDFHGDKCENDDFDQDTSVQSALNDGYTLYTIWSNYDGKFRLNKGKVDTSQNVEDFDDPRYFWQFHYIAFIGVSYKSSDIAQNSEENANSVD